MRITRRYLGCWTKRVTCTTMVFSIFALVTLPISSVVFAGAAVCVSAVITPSLPLPPLSAVARAAASSRAPNLFSLHAAASALPPVRWKAGNEAGKSFRSILSAALRARWRPLRESFPYAAASEPSCAGDEFGRDGQLVRRKSQSFAGNCFVDARHFEHHAARLYHRHPLFRSAFALAHA